MRADRQKDLAWLTACGYGVTIWGHVLMSRGSGHVQAHLAAGREGERVSTSAGPLEQAHFAGRAPRATDREGLENEHLLRASDI